MSILLVLVVVPAVLFKFATRRISLPTRVVSPRVLLATGTVPVTFWGSCSTTDPLTSAPLDPLNTFQQRYRFLHLALEPLPPKRTGDRPVRPFAYPNLLAWKESELPSRSPTPTRIEHRYKSPGETGNICSQPRLAVDIWLSHVLPHRPRSYLVPFPLCDRGFAV
ncbi:hypothetical protein BJX65DRAFT_246850 [Aspergillus insuetus]